MRVIFMNSKCNGLWLFTGGGEPYTIHCTSHKIRKRTFGNMRPAKIQISLRIRAVWSESSLGALGYPRMQSFYMRTTDTYAPSHNIRKRTFGHMRPAKIQISLRIRAVWSESSLGALGYPRMQSFYMRTTDTYAPSHNIRKRTFGHMRPAKIQIGLRIRAVRSESLLDALGYPRMQSFYIRTTVTRRFTSCYDASLGAHVRRYGFELCNSYTNMHWRHLCHCQK